MSCFTEHSGTLRSTGHLASLNSLRSVAILYSPLILQAKKIATSYAPWFVAHHRIFDKLFWFCKNIILDLSPLHYYVKTEAATTLQFH